MPVLPSLLVELAKPETSAAWLVYSRIRAVLFMPHVSACESSSALDDFSINLLTELILTDE